MVKIFIDDTDNGGDKTRVCDPAPAACALPTSLSCLTRIHINLPSVQVFPKCLFKKQEALGSLGLEYIEGSRTMDTLRYGKTESQLPFQFSFSDKANVKWVVEVDKQDDNVNFMIPCGSQMLWYGADESPTKTGSDAMTDWASIGVSWQDKTWLPPYHAGVRIEFEAYKEKASGEWKVDSERWNHVLDQAKKGAQ
mgnify:CR=1 FL=1